MTVSVHSVFFVVLFKNSNYILTERQISGIMYSTQDKYENISPETDNGTEWGELVYEWIYREYCYRAG